MSLILDALRKSELARRAGRAPVYRDGASPDPAPLLRGLTIMAGVVLFAALTISAWMLNRPEPLRPADELKPRVESAAVTIPATTPMEAARASASLNTMDDNRTPPFAVAAGSAPRAASEPKPAVRTVSPANGDPATAPWFNALPDAFRAKLPKLVITIHVYAPDEGQRILYINNRPLQRGADIDGVVVEEIVPEGAVLRAHGQRFRIPRPS